MATLEKVRIDSTNGRVAIFTVDSSNPNDDAPLTDRLNHASRLRMHTDAPHVGVVTTLSGSVTIPQDSLTTAPVQYTLAAHGQPYTPSVLINFSATQNDGVVVSGPLVGSVPFVVWPQQGKLCFLSAYADATNIKLNIYYDGSASPPSTPTQIGNWPFTVTWSALVFDVGFDSNGAVVPKASGNVLFDASAGYIVASGGAFDTRRRYAYADAPGAYRIPSGRTLYNWFGIWDPNYDRYHVKIGSPTFDEGDWPFYRHGNDLITNPRTQVTTADVPPVTLLGVTA